MCGEGRAGPGQGDSGQMPGAILRSGGLARRPLFGTSAAPGKEEGNVLSSVLGGGSILPNDVSSFNVTMSERNVVNTKYFSDIIMD